MRAGEPGALEALLCVLSIGGGRVRSGEYLLPCSRRALPNRLPERRDIGGDLGRARRGMKRRDHDFERFTC